MPFDAQCALCCCVPSVEERLAYPPAGTQPRAAARQNRQRRREHGTVLSYANLACPRRLIGGIDATPFAVDARAEIATLCDAGVELRCGGKRTRCALCSCAAGPSRWVGAGCWLLRRGMSIGSRIPCRVPAGQLRLALDQARNRTSTANMLLRPSHHQRNNCLSQHDRSLMVLALSPGFSQHFGPQSRSHLGGPCLVLCGAVPRRFRTAPATCAFSFGFSELAKYN